MATTEKKYLLRASARGKSVEIGAEGLTSLEIETTIADTAALLGVSITASAATERLRALRALPRPAKRTKTVRPTDAELEILLGGRARSIFTEEASRVIFARIAARAKGEAPAAAAVDEELVAAHPLSPTDGADFFSPETAKAVHARRNTKKEAHHG